MEEIYLDVLSPLTRVIPFALLYVKTRPRTDAYFFPLLVLLCGVTASVINGLSQNADFAWELHYFFLLLTPFCILTCDPCWPFRSRKVECILVFNLLTVAFSATFGQWVMVTLLVYCLTPLAVYGVLSANSHWIKKGNNLARVVFAIIFGVLASLAFGGNDWQKSVAHIGVSFSCTLALMAIDLTGTNNPLPVAVPEAHTPTHSQQFSIASSSQTEEDMEDIDLEQVGPTSLSS